MVSFPLVFFEKKKRGNYNLIVVPYMLALILDLILGPHVKERCILPLQTSHAQHRACPCVSLPLEVIVEPLLPQSDQLHHMNKVDDVGDDEADDKTAKHEHDPKVGSSIGPARLSEELSQT